LTTITTIDTTTSTITEKEEEDREETTYSREDQIYDYLSISGLNTRFALDGKRFDTFIIKEAIDNALDFIEENAREFVNRKYPFIDVIITEEENNEKEKIVKIRVRNSNAGIKNSFTEERINQIFNLNEYYSSKKYRHKINRGELGDAFKAVLCIPYAIAVNKYDESNIYQNWDYPLQINISNDNRTIEIRIDNFDKIRRKEEPRTDKKYFQFQNNEEEYGEREINDYNHFTEIVIYLPKVAVNYDEISNLLKRYIVENTHIEFNIKLSNQQQGLYYYPATQKIKSDWKNKLSVYSYNLSDFKYLIRSLEKSKDNLNAYDNFIHTNFREGWRLKKDEFFETLTYDDLKKDDKKIEMTYQKLKESLPPIKDQSSSLVDLELPFDMNKKVREKALEERLKQIYFIKEGKGNFIYKKFDGYYENPNDNNNGVQFPYKLEIVIAKSPILKQKRLTLIESLNCSPSLHSTSLFHTTNKSIFEWEKKNGEPWTTNDITIILEDCGYSDNNEELHKKNCNLIMINLISPRIDYKSHSKSNIDLRPFAVKMGQDIYNFCKIAESRNKNNNDESITDNNKYHLRIWLKERLEAVQKDPTLLTTGRITLDGVYYRLRTKLDRMGIPIKDREYIKSSIKDICDEMGLKRDELGIIAADRAQFYYKGRSYGVGIDAISELAQYAADIVIIEKQGAVEALTSFADKQRIALLYTRGFSTEYALELTEKTESNIIVLTDLDADGLLIASKLPDNRPIYRVGVNQQMLDYFGLDFDDVSETYTPQKGHYDTVAEYLENNNYNLISKDMFRRLKKQRVEIDSVLSKVGSNEDFWDYIIQFLEEKFPNRNYNRSIDVPKSVRPWYLQEFISNADKIISKAQEPKRQQILDELEYTEEIFEDIETKEEEIEEEILSSSEDNPEVKKLKSIIEEFKTLFD
jgi:hypothetical protein